VALRYAGAGHFACRRSGSNGLQTRCEVPFGRTGPTERGRTTVSEYAGPAIEVRIGAGGIDDALRVAEVASELGADRVGVSTPLIYAHGLEIVAKIRRQTRDVPVLANLTIHDGCFRFLAESRRLGAEFGTVSALHNYAGCRQGVRARLAMGI